MIKTLSSSKFLIPAMAILAMLATSAGFYISLKKSQQSTQANPGIEGLFWPNPKQMNAFSMLDQNGESFGLTQLRGKWSFIFFGYTQCPDVCPITMAVMADVYKQLALEDNNVQVIFTSVDPDRDTTEILFSYVSYFNEHFIGLGGSTDMVDSLTKQIGIAYYLNKEDNADNYLVDHSASIFLFDPKARMVGKLSPPHQKDIIINQFKSIQQFIDAQQ